MKRIFLLGFPFILAFSICFGGTAETPEVFIQKIYMSDHKPMSKRGIDFTKRESLARYFDGDLTDLFIKDFECRKKEQGGVCNLDFDPILDAQDFDEKTKDLKIVNVSGQPNVFNVTFTNLGTRTLIYNLKKTPKGWRISDIKYPEGPSLKELLSGEVK
jgi:hypothetical protein